MQYSISATEMPVKTHKKVPSQLTRARRAGKYQNRLLKKVLSDLRYIGQGEITKGRGGRREWVPVDRIICAKTGNKREHGGFGEMPNIPFA